MKGHVGVESESKLIHSVVATAANVADNRMLPAGETAVWGRPGLTGPCRNHPRARAGSRGPGDRRWRTKPASLPGPARAQPCAVDNPLPRRACFRPLKLRFGFTKVRYRGLAKNTHRLLSTCALVNLPVARKHLRQSLCPDLRLKTRLPVETGPYRPTCNETTETAT